MSHNINYVVVKPQSIHDQCQPGHNIIIIAMPMWQVKSLLNVLQPTKNCTHAVCNHRYACNMKVQMVYLP